jgi:RimJ/RimL family protein N-acetyltransferase
LRALLPEKAYLTLDPHEWAQLLPQIWANRAARRHPRLYLRWRRRTLPQWRALLPPAFELVAVDAALLGRHGLQHYDELVERVSAWHSTGDFLQNGFGFGVMHGSAIVSRCIADCVVGDRCEIGVGTSLDYRGRGLAAAVVAATVEHCLERGFKQIGWHCLRSNAGSRALAEKVGFELVTEYNAYSAVLPAENAHDLAAAEYRDWALHYEHFVEESFWYRLFAAEAWALAGERARALEHLRALVESDWHGHATWLAQRWGLHSLRDQPEFQAILAALPGGS